MARLNTATRHKVVVLHQQGLSQAKISKQTGVSRCAVQALLKKHKETGNVEDRRRSGRPRKLSVADERHIMLTSLQNRKMSSSAISSELAVTCGTQVHPSTIRRSLGRRAAVALAAEAGIFSPTEEESEDALLKMSVLHTDSTTPALSDDSRITEDESKSGLLPED
ncbi:hypothetical protein JOB18_013095 [Solea senegalensis]|uniref:26S proteasome non-ATPase regulatory subunit 4-like n=1 Tax=Solea senegalensis TaxID=28829 RepID=A0AAV6PPJ1_SOLSE|nr:26S proteasome non-ATPase regulatory subunit 4-like [Solea senegalensis]KAG7474593.1 hypothetical protein JOB18_013095 [Solea senegalensis]KAG7474594.1 hypothetical protein JOB18_013095 [Solea senegalensis]KAG7474595.1 hypothetical protein JOB18_013095 [Solea senegalensis]